jgi:hypothetical protein
VTKQGEYAKMRKTKPKLWARAVRQKAAAFCLPAARREAREVFGREN